MRRELNGERLRLELMKCGLDQKRFAELCDVAPWTIPQACARRPIKPKTFVKIVSTLAKMPALLHAEVLLTVEAAVAAR